MVSWVAERQMVTWKNSSLIGAVFSLHDEWVNKRGPEPLDVELPQLDIPDDGAEEEGTDQPPLMV